VYVYAQSARKDESVAEWNRFEDRVLASQPPDGTRIIDSYSQPKPCHRSGGRALSEGKDGRAPVPVRFRFRFSALLLFPAPACSNSLKRGKRATFESRCLRCCTFKWMLTSPQPDGVHGRVLFRLIANGAGIISWINFV
jgi:hypothetical protein